MTPTNIALVTCSTRDSRLGPFITAYVHEILQEELSRRPESPRLSILDLADQNLPLNNEPGIPSLLPESDPTPHYVYEHTRRWSTVVRQYDAFIFVTPQYNWSIPAALKNALDYLFHEWKGKPVGIVTYGGRGGGKAGDHLQNILKAMRMHPAETMAAITVGRKTLEFCLANGRASEEDKEAWRGSGVEGQVRSMFAEILQGSPGP
ncbi:flavoprotein-like protein [Aspergillus spinulosporus]